MPLSNLFITLDNHYAYILIPFKGNLAMNGEPITNHS